MQKTAAFFILGFITISCARVGMPTGGPKDITPPKFINASPKNLSVNVDKELKQITLDFDEYVVVRDVSKNIIISPSIQIPPVIEPTGAARKNVTVKFHEPLKENTTYTINFGASIQDNNEGNKLENFSYTFSTGAVIDSLELLGTVKSKLDRKPHTPLLVSLYKIEKNKKGKDSINLKSKPYYITKADDEGNFKLAYLNRGEYKLIAFNDLNLNYIPDTEKELVGFHTQIVDPAKPENYSLDLAPAKQAYRVVETKQEGQGVIKVRYKGSPNRVTITALEKGFPPIKTVHSNYADSLYIYFDSNKLVNFDKKTRIKFLNQYQEKIDTINVLYDNSVKTELNLGLVEKEITPSTYFSIKSNNYITSIDPSKIEVLKSNIPIEYTTEIDTLSHQAVHIKFPVTFETVYNVNIKPEAINDILGQTNKDSLSYTITTKKPNIYGNLKIGLINKPENNFFFQLLDEKYEVVESIYGNNNEFEFLNLNPKKYIIRILVDENNNGLWDYANLEEFIPAEKTYLYPEFIEVRAYWNLNETWTLLN